MKNLMTAAAAVVFAAAVLPASAADAPTMKIVSFTGQVQIKMPDGSIVGVVPGAALPAIPAGAEVTVVSGEAVLATSNGVAVSAKQGDSFSFSAADGQVQVAALTPTTSVKVTVGATEATVSNGAKIQVAVASPGKADVSVVQGQASVTVNGQAQTLSAGQSVTAAAPAAAAPQTAQAQPQAATTETTTASETTTATAGATSSAPPSNPAQDTTVSQSVSPSSP